MLLTVHLQAPILLLFVSEERTVTIIIINSGSQTEEPLPACKVANPVLAVGIPRNS